VKRYLIEVLIYISIMVSDVDQAVFGEMSIQVIFFPLIELVVVTSYRSSLHVLNINSLSDMRFKCFFPFCGFPSFFFFSQ
jgi:hypothetical protein